MTSTKYTRDVYKELLISLVASLFMGFGVLFLLLWVGIYVWRYVWTNSLKSQCLFCVFNHRDMVWLIFCLPLCRSLGLLIWKNTFQRNNKHHRLDLIGLHWQCSGITWTMVVFSQVKKFIQLLGCCFFFSLICAMIAPFHRFYKMLKVQLKVCFNLTRCVLEIRWLF